MESISFLHYFLGQTHDPSFMVCAFSKQKHWHTLTSVPVAISGAHRGQPPGNNIIWPGHTTTLLEERLFLPVLLGLLTMPSGHPWLPTWPRGKRGLGLGKKQRHDFGPFRIMTQHETEGFLYNKAAGTLELEPFLVANLGFRINCLLYDCKHSGLNRF